MKHTISSLMKLKQDGSKITMLTAYDHPMANMLQSAGVDVLLVGDSLANVVLGFKNTLAASMQDMLRHTQAVTNGAPETFVVSDMPFGSYQTSPQVAFDNASLFLSKGQAQAVKLEGGTSMNETIAFLVNRGIPVMGHVGLTPQSLHQIGQMRMMGKSHNEADAIFQDALSVQKAGAFSVVLECVEPTLAKNITQKLSIPTIGIGSGPDCDGQVLVTHDLVGLNVGHVPKFVKPKANLKELLIHAAQQFVKEVKQS